jgi:hypothetical protein
MAHRDLLRTIQEVSRFGRAYYRHRYDRPPESFGGSPTQTSANEQMYYDLVLRQLDWQIRAGDALDLKIATWFTLVTALIPITAGLLAAEHTRLRGMADVIAVLLAGAGTLAWVGVVRFLYRAYIPNRFEMGPKLSEFETAVSSYETQQLLLETAHFIASDTIPHNQDILVEKADDLVLAVRLFLIEFLFYGASVTISFLL